jgi:glucosamine 6-phosphate synthetase-like amidotransferase/phosphosugar isomerase protein
MSILFSKPTQTQSTDSFLALRSNNTQKKRNVFLFQDKHICSPSSTAENILEQRANARSKRSSSQKTEESKAIYILCLSTTYHSSSTEILLQNIPNLFKAEVWILPSSCGGILGLQKSWKLLVEHRMGYCFQFVERIN